MSRNNSRTIVFLATIMMAFLCPAYSEEANGKPGDQVLQELGAFLTNGQMERLIPRDKVAEIYSLSKREDMEITDNYLVSDELLLLLNKRAVLHTDFGVLIEKLQNIADSLPEGDRNLLLSNWKALWLDKTSKFVRYESSLKRKWTFTYSHTLDFDSNVKLEPLNISGDMFSDKSDVGISNSAGFQLRPFVNVPSMKNWIIETVPGLSARNQASVKEVQFNTLGVGQVVAYDSPRSFITRTHMSWGYDRNYSTDPDHERMQGGQQSAALRFQFWPVRYGEKAFFTSRNCKLGISYRGRKDFRDASLPATLDGSLDQDSDSWNLNIGENFSSYGKGKTFQTLGWNVEYETSSASPAANRDYFYLTLGLNYSRNISAAFSKNPMSWRSGLSYRAKEKDSPKPYDATKAPTDQDLDSEGQVSFSTSLRATWSRNWSSTLGLTYTYKAQDKVGGSSDNVNQYRVSWTNTFLTF